jgi:hypothetical protein
MHDKQTKTETDGKGRPFLKRYDFYWKFISLYAVAILVYGLLKGTIDEWTFTVVLLDPVVILLIIFIFFTYVGLSIESYKKAKVIIGKDFFILRNRFRQRKFSSSDIAKIIIGKEVIRGQGKFRIIKIKLQNRRRILRIRPSGYWNDVELLNEFTQLKRNINK